MGLSPTEKRRLITAHTLLDHTPEVTDGPLRRDCGHSVAALQRARSPQAVVVPRPPKRTLTDNGRLLAHITNAALRHDTRIRHSLCSATEPHGTVQASIPMAMADAVPSEELRSFLLRLYSAWGTQDFEPSRPGDRLIRSGAIVANDGLISRRRRLAGMLLLLPRSR